MHARRHRPSPDRRQPDLGPAPPPASLGLRFRALLGLGFVPPPEPRPCAHCAPSPTRCSRLPASLYAAIEQIRNRRPGRCHREVPSASPSSRPPRAAARVPLSHCVGPGALAGKNRTVCIPFSPNARKGPLPGNILALCIHFRAQSGDSGYMARESCRQGPFFASRGPKSCMARRCCQRRPAFPRQRHATRGMAERALRPAARAWPACRMRAPCHLACVRRRPRSSPPSYTRRASPPASRPPRPVIRRAAHCGRGELSIGLFLPPSCCPRRRISLPARRTHPASRADPPRPGNKRNNTSNSMRA